ncbi:MAG: hypothetical protein IKD68_11000 [Solobacterium sp.]|nr:hypothetical protein [Solobacterium sp.]
MKLLKAAVLVSLCAGAAYVLPKLITKGMEMATDEAEKELKRAQEEEKALDDARQKSAGPAPDEESEPEPAPAPAEDAAPETETPKPETSKEDAAPADEAPETEAPVEKEAAAEKEDEKPEEK